MKTNIPIFRAKTIKQDYNEWEECQQLKKIAGIWYAIGFYDCKREVKTYLGDWETTHLILIRKSTATSEVNTSEVIDISTLSIHFPDMIDSQGNKIFASLSEDGKGGDIILEPYLETERETVLSYENYIKNIIICSIQIHCM
jgi:hypothetical protein